MSHRFISSAARLSFLGAALALLGACAKPASPSAMVPDVAGIGAGPASAYRSAITVGEVSGGSKTSPLWTSQVDNPEFREALVRALMESGLGRADNGRLRLDAVLQKLEQPFAGFAMTVNATIAYRLTEAATGAVVYDKAITTPATATMDDAIDGQARLRIANERAIRANLRQLIEELYALPDRPDVTSSRRT
jgi:hypothetical protein